MSKMSLIKRVALCLSLLSLINSSFAQDSSSDILAQTRSDIIAVSALGVVGAVLGLSTLSFVDEPKDHLKNIVVGGAIGIIVGVGVVAFTQASKSQKIYKTAFVNKPEFSTNNRLAWHKAMHRTFSASTKKPHQNVANFNFQF